MVSNVNIPILDKEDVESIEESANEEDIRDRVVKFMIKEGYKHSPPEEEEEEREGKGEGESDDTSDFFVKGGTLVEVIITRDVDEEVLEQMISGIV